MLVEEVAQRLDGVSAISGRVSGALELATLLTTDAKPQVTPCAFVLPLAADAAPHRMATGMHIQTITQRIGVVLVVEKPDDATGQGSVAVLDTMQRDVIGALAGWHAPSSDTVFDLVRARLLDLRAGMAFLQIDFSTTTQLRLTNG